MTASNLPLPPSSAGPRVQRLLESDAANRQAVDAWAASLPNAELRPVVVSLLGAIRSLGLTAAAERQLLVDFQTAQAAQAAEAARSPKGKAASKAKPAPAAPPLSAAEANDAAALAESPLSYVLLRGCRAEWARDDAVRFDDKQVQGWREAGERERASLLERTPEAPPEGDGTPADAALREGATIYALSRALDGASLDGLTGNDLLPAYRAELALRRKEADGAADPDQPKRPRGTQLPPDRDQWTRALVDEALTVAGVLAGPFVCTLLAAFRRHMQETREPDLVSWLVEAQTQRQGGS